MTCHKGWSRDCAVKKIVRQGDGAVSARRSRIAHRVLI